MDGAVIVMPRGVRAWPTAEALWITAREWARAAERRFGEAWIATADGCWTPAELPRPAPAATRSRRRPLPLPLTVRTLAKDARLWARQSRFEVPPDGGPWRQRRLRLVWEHHDLFNRAGRSLADAHAAPLVRYVHAPQVWEARQWGVRRPLWGDLIERRWERRGLRTADRVACVSAAVAGRLREMGVAGDRLVVCPMGVDPDRFSPAAGGGGVRRTLGLGDGDVVVGWCGSFRGFHGVEHLVEAFAAAQREAPQLRLLLVGDGPQRTAVEALAARSGIGPKTRFTGSLPHLEMPAHVAAMDLAVVSSQGAGGFHYSPLKLREYAACGRPVAAPRQGELADLEGSGFVTLHPPGDAAVLAGILRRMAGQPELRRRQGAAARAWAVEHWTWDAQLEKVLASLRGAGDDG
jgi:glycosyltransferase involved in cell wall biosynthesis